MKKLVIFLALCASILISQTSFADSRFYNRGYNNWGYNHSFGYNRDFGRGYNRWGSRYYNPYRGGSYFNVSYGNRYGRYGYGRYGYGRWGHRRYDSGDLIGGIVLGSLLTSSYRDYRDSRSYERVVYRRPVTTTREVVYVNSGNNQQTRASSGRKLLRDLDGNCFEISYNSAGDEVRTQLEPSVCAY